MIAAHRPPRVAPPAIVRDPDVVAGYLEDASGTAPGQAAGVARIESESEASALLQATLASGEAILCQAGRTSLTAGAVPRGEVVVSVERMRAIGPIERNPGGGRVIVDPGVRLDDLRRALALHELYYPPVPTYEQARIGGTVSTNAGGAATFKYGVTRPWVRALRVVLFDGDVVEVERGEESARPGEELVVRRTDGSIAHIPVPRYRLPDVKKLSAGYHAGDPLDLVDLFVGAEGTLGLITSITLDLVPQPPGLVTALVFVADFDRAIGLAAELRRAALAARAARDRRGPDVRAIEVVDSRGLALLTAAGDTGRLRVRVPAGAGTAVLLDLELPERPADGAVEEALLAACEGTAADTPLARLLSILRRHASLDDVELALPGDEARRAALRELREAVPQRVAELLAERRRAAPGLHKVAGDLVVPFERVAEIVRCFEAGFSARGLDYAIWGHLSDGNLHPNALVRDEREVARGIEALHEFAGEAVRLGGAPLSEHGVGRDPVKQRMLRRFLGDAAIGEMRAIKRALDPPGRFAPGVLFPVTPATSVP